MPPRRGKRSLNNKKQFRALLKLTILQMFSNDAVNTGVGVYWMFYSGGSFEEAAVPSGFPGAEPGVQAEGLRY